MDDSLVSWSSKSHFNSVFVVIPPFNKTKFTIRWHMDDVVGFVAGEKSDSLPFSITKTILHNIRPDILSVID